MTGQESGIAGLPMYDPPQLFAVVDAWWTGIARWFRQEGIDDAPAGLSRGFSHHELWSHPALVLAQTCGYPLMTQFRDRLAYIATPSYAAPGCGGALYRSLIVVSAKSPFARLDELRGRRAVINNRDSHSGMNALRATVAPLARAGRFLGEVVESGSHAASLEWVGDGRADVASIDCITFALLGDVRPEATARVRVIAESASAPGLPYVTAAAAGPERVARMRRALQQAVTDPELAPIRARLRLTGFEVLDLDTYAPMAASERRAAELGYPALA